MTIRNPTGNVNSKIRYRYLVSNKPLSHYVLLALLLRRARGIRARDMKNQHSALYYTLAKGHDPRPSPGEPTEPTQAC